MFIPVWLLTLMGTVAFGIIAWAWTYLFNEIKKLVECQAKCQNNLLERRAEDKDSHISKLDLVKIQISEISIWKAKTEELMVQNKKEHNELIKMMEKMDKSMRDLEKCVNLMIAGKDC